MLADSKDTVLHFVQLTRATPPTRMRPMAAELPKIWLAPPVKVAEGVGTAAASVPDGAAAPVVVPLVTG